MNSIEGNPPSHVPPRGRSGFTLIEVMVASLLLVIVMAGFVPFFLSGLERSSQGRYASSATNLARERIEQIRRLDYREIQEDTANPSDPANLSMRFTTEDSAELVRGQSPTVAYLVQASTSGGGELKKVTVTVDWPGVQGSSPAVMSTLIHQQFLGPRIASLTLAPTTTDDLGTPFPRLQRNTTVKAKYHIAQADWDLVLVDPSIPSPTRRNTYFLLRLVPDSGAPVNFGNPADDHRISCDATHLKWTADGSGVPNDVWLEFNIDVNSAPDGYWELQAVAYNEWEQPGNIWRQRIRIDKESAAGAQSFTAVGQADNETIELRWLPSPDNDIVNWVLERKVKPDPLADWSTVAWTTLTTLVGTASEYTDHGTMGSVHPWGDPGAGVTNYYRYRLYPVDIDGYTGTKVEAQEQLPTLTTTTTLVPPSSTTTVSTTSTTAGTFTVTVRNEDNQAFDLTVYDAGNSAVRTGRVSKNGGTIDFSGLGMGSYDIVAVEDRTGGRTINASFSLPGQAGQTVLTILK